MMNLLDQAAVYGSGCWAQDATDESPAVACSTSGNVQHWRVHDIGN